MTASVNICDVYMQLGLLPKLCVIAIKEIEGAKMSYKWLFDAGEFVPEHRHDGQVGVIEIMKVGGGTVGQSYDGSWLWRVYVPGTWNIKDQDEYASNVVETHQEVAKTIDELLLSDL